jgi:hypothetical protein
MIKAIKAFTSSLNAANRMGKAPIFLKHKAKNIGRVIKRNPKKSIAGLAVKLVLRLLKHLWLKQIKTCRNAGF